MNADRALPSPRALLPLIAALSLFASLPLIVSVPSANWHDMQRVGQIATVVLVAALTLTRAFYIPSIVDRSTRHVIAALALAGALSAALSRQPTWAFAELALALGSLGLSRTIAVVRLQTGRVVDRMILATVFFICAALSLQFLVAYAAALTSDSGPLNPWLLLSGFSNLRFYGQFISLSLPLLAVPLLMRDDSKRFSVLAVVLLSLWWAIALTSGTRGTWLGMAVSMLWLAFAGSCGRRWAMLQITGAAAGLFVFQIWMDWLPQLLDIRVEGYAGDRLTTSLSGRESIWRQATTMILARPLLGFGPMHFADIPNPVAAHPHQGWLQWASEWGVPSALAVTWLVWRGMCAVFRIMLTHGNSTAEPDVLRVCLAGSMAAALAQSMVDGVLVMPYTQIWLAVLGGWLFALQPRNTEAPVGKCAWAWSWSLALVFASAMLSFVLVRDFPDLQEREKRFAGVYGGHLQPRFWLQGVIADNK